MRDTTAIGGTGEERRVKKWWRGDQKPTGCHVAPASWLRYMTRP